MQFNDSLQRIIDSWHIMAAAIICTELENDAYLFSREGNGFPKGYPLVGFGAKPQYSLRKLSYTVASNWGGEIMSKKLFSAEERPVLYDLAHFLESSPTAWHAVAESANRLRQTGFRELHENEQWHLQPGERFFVSRNGSSLIACILPRKTPRQAYVCASHTDSPALKLKPKAIYRKEHMAMFGVDVYGSPMLTSWLNRDLGLAGRVVYADQSGDICEQLVNISEAPLVIPQLAIHLDRDSNKQGVQLNRQEHLAAIASFGITSDSAALNYFEKLLKKHVSYRHLYSSDLFLYPLEGPKFVGPDCQMLAAYRIDSLSSVHAILEAFLHEGYSSDHTMKICVMWDNEEIGSSTAHGAESPFFAEILERITLALDMSRADYLQLIPSSLCVSVDLAHALHPNYAERHEPQHRCLLGEGVVIKHSAQHRYASDARTAGLLMDLCRRHSIPIQTSISRADIPSGTTLGPIHANCTGMPTVDIGSPQLSMHSARELLACRDHLYLIKLLTAFYNDAI
jgi:aspartyl aminopeptidase